MLNIIKTATKESIFYKLPTLIGDILIQVGVLLFLLHGTDMVRENNLPLYEQSGSWFLLAVSAILSAWILGIKLNERGRSPVNIANRAILDASFTFILYNGLMALIYELVLQGKLLGLQAVLTGFFYAIWHLVVRKLIGWFRSKGANNYTVVLVGSDPNILQVCQYLNGPHSELGYNVLGMFTTHPADIPEGVTNLGVPERAIQYVEDNHALLKEVYCSLNPATECS